MWIEAPVLGGPNGALIIRVRVRVSAYCPHLACCWTAGLLQGVSAMGVNPSPFGSTPTARDEPVAAAALDTCVAPPRALRTADAAAGMLRGTSAAGAAGACASDEGARPGMGFRCQSGSR